MDISGMVNWPVFVLGGLGSIAGWLAKRAIADMDQRQSDLEGKVSNFCDSFNAALARLSERSAADQTNFHREHAEDIDRLRSEIGSNSKDIARLLERTGRPGRSS